MAIKSINSLAREAEEQNLRLSDLVVREEAVEAGVAEATVRGRMHDMLIAMIEAVKAGVDKSGPSVSGLTGGEALRYSNYLRERKSLLGDVAAKAAAYALAASCVNASMGVIVAAPTAGSCGILPGVLLSLRETHGFTEEELVSGLLAAAGVGQAIAMRATLSGAEGGCQAECGSAAAMAAAAAVELMGGAPEMCCHGAALALKNSLGLVCDPVAGLVEVPCVKRNGVYAVVALTAADMALAGIQSAIPLDEVIDAMHAIGQVMPATLRETAKGGLAATPTGCRLSAKVFPEQAE